MSPTLETWYVVEDVLSDHGELLVRMVPDHFNSDIAEPVLEFLIKEPTDDIQARYATSRFRTEAVVDVQLSSTAIELWGEYDDAPVLISGASVSFSRSAYAANDLLRVVHSLEAQLNKWQSENVKLRTQAHEIRSYAADLLRRAEAKKSLTTRSTAIEDAQIDVLQRMLNKIGGA